MRILTFHFAAVVLLLDAASALPAAAPQSTAVSQPAFAAGKALKTLDGAIAALKAAYAEDPQAAQVRGLQDTAAKKLEDLRKKVQAVHDAGPTLDGFLAAGQAGVDLSPVRQAVQAVARENSEWQLDEQVDPNRLFNHPLAPDSSKTVQTLRAIHKTVYNEITGPPAKFFLAEIGGQIKVLAGRWKEFFENVTLQEYPWESAANAAFDRKRPFTDIPKWQLKFLHPISGIVAYQGRGSSSGSPLIGGEAIGVQWFDPDAHYKPTWGVGILVTMKAQGERSSGIGLMGSYRDFKFGLRRSKLSDGRNVNQAVISINLARYLDFSGNDLLKQAIERMKQDAKP